MSFPRLAPAVAVVALIGTPIAHAQSSVSSYGLVDLSFGSFQYAGLDGSADNERTTKVESGQMTTSFIGFKGQEDLGGGLKAGFVLESFFRGDAGGAGRTNTDVFWARNANVSLSGDFGKVALGRMDNLLFVQSFLFNPFGSSFGFSPTIRLTYGKWGPDRGDSGWSNSVLYATPNLSGFSAAVQWQPKESDTTSDSVGVTAGYTAGAFGIGFGWQRVGAATAPKTAIPDPGKQTFWLLGTSYDAGFAKFFGQAGEYEDKDITGGFETRLYQLGAAVPVTADGKVLASWGQSKREPVAGGTEIKQTIFTLGYDHYLSKRTDLYAVYMLEDRDQAGYEKGNSIGFGIRHRF